MSNIHALHRTAFPVAGETFLVDSSFEFTKELGQGEFLTLVGWTGARSEEKGVERLS